MVSMSPPQVDGEDDQASEPSKSLRLSDAERIATKRLAGAETAPERHVAEPVMPALDAAPVAEPRDGQWYGASEQAPPALVENPTALPAEGIAAPDIAAAEMVAGGGLAPVPAQHFSTGAASDLPAPAAAPSVGMSAAGRAEPLASALDAAARLTADATAAAEALESLQRLLQRQLPNVTGAPAPAAPRANADAWPPAAAPPTTPPPLPAPPVHDGGDNGHLSEHAAQLPPPNPARPMPQERRRFDVRGFLAGFALSWAFGVVLYLFMTAG